MATTERERERGMSDAITIVRELFASKGFAFTEGKLRERPRYFGVAKGCTLELVGAGTIEQTTMVAIVAPDQLPLAQQNALRMTALLALLANEAGARWCSKVLKMISANPATEQTLEDTLVGYDLRMVSNRAKSTITLRIRKKRE
jgi:hypothetical protein